MRYNLTQTENRKRKLLLAYRRRVRWWSAWLRDPNARLTAPLDRLRKRDERLKEKR